MRMRQEHLADLARDLDVGIEHEVARHLLGDGGRAFRARPISTLPMSLIAARSMPLGSMPG